MFYFPDIGQSGEWEWRKWQKGEKVDLIEYNGNLPATTEELHKFILIETETLKAYKAKISAIEKVGSAHAAKEVALTDAQDVSEFVLKAEAKLGEMLVRI